MLIADIVFDAFTPPYACNKKTFPSVKLVAIVDANNVSFGLTSEN